VFEPDMQVRVEMYW